jgi:FlaA1/EpsC-like NDP-sugar epimerase
MAAQIFEGKRIIVTGGTGSLGQVLIRRLLSCERGRPAKVVVFSRDEAKQHYMQVQYQHAPAVGNEAAYENSHELLQFRIGDVRDASAVIGVLRQADIVINAAAMKQIPTCEYFPFEAIRTNVEGAENIVRAIEVHDLPVETVVGVSTDKACKPVNTMGMTKALQERIFIQGNLRCANTRFVCVRYGNVLASRGSVIPLFHEQIRRGGPLTITSKEMTRFLLSLEEAVDTVFAAVESGQRGETYVPKARSARIVDVATALINGRDIGQVVVGIRPGEKTHEILVSEDEVHRTIGRGRWYVVLPHVPELLSDPGVKQALAREFSSADDVMSLDATRSLLAEHDLLLEPASRFAELLR